MSGLHLHVNLQGDDAGLHPTHVHQSDPDGHGHAADTDVSVFELGMSWTKVMVFLLPIAFALLGIIWLVQSFLPPPFTGIALQRTVRWRPPLRAPPLYI